MDALRSDLVDIQGGTTGEGIHCGVMAGTVVEVISTFGGLDLSGEIPLINPALPVHWTGLEFGFSFKGTHYQVTITDGEVKISARNATTERIKVHICGTDTTLPPERTVSVKLAKTIV